MQYITAKHRRRTFIRWCFESIEGALAGRGLWPEDEIEMGFEGLLNPWYAPLATDQLGGGRGSLGLLSSSLWCTALFPYIIARLDMDLFLAKE